MYCLERNGTGGAFQSERPFPRNRRLGCDGTGPIYKLAVYSAHLAFLSSEAFLALALTKVLPV
jgi:hypothetical protein